MCVISPLGAETMDVITVVHYDLQYAPHYTGTSSSPSILPCNHGVDSIRDSTFDVACILRDSDEVGSLASPVRTLDVIIEQDACLLRPRCSPGSPVSPVLETPGGSPLRELERGHLDNVNLMRAPKRTHESHTALSSLGMSALGMNKVP
jgi:hypothetical protein